MRAAQHRRISQLRSIAIKVATMLRAGKPGTSA